jgi:hypothetical protein
MEIEENVNSGRENGSFQRYLLETEKVCNLQQLSAIAETTTPRRLASATRYGYEVSRRSHLLTSP